MNKFEKPNYPAGSKEKEAYDIIHTILDCMLNRHIHRLTENGYLNEKKHSSEYGYEDQEPKKALKMKWKLIDEAQARFAEQLAEKLKP
jgi:hypothetical protein